VLSSVLFLFLVCCFVLLTYGKILKSKRLGFGFFYISIGIALRVSPFIARMLHPCSPPECVAQLKTTPKVGAKIQQPQRDEKSIATRMKKREEPQRGDRSLPWKVERSAEPKWVKARILFGERACTCTPRPAGNSIERAYCTIIF